MNPYFITDLGSCHGHQVKETKAFLHELKNVGVHAIKFQYWSDPQAFAEARHHPELAEQYKRWSTELAFIEEMGRVAEAIGLDLICSVFLEKDVPVIAPMVDHFKIASLEAKDRRLLVVVDQYSYGKDILISTGCTTQEDMQYFNQLRENRAAAKLHSCVQLLHCTSAYPAPVEEMNLKSLQNNRMDGLSDHSCNPVAGVVALCFGARIFEFHGKLESTPSYCHDYESSMYIDEIENYVDCVNDARAMFGEPLRAITKSEEKLLSFRRAT